MHAIYLAFATIIALNKLLMPLEGAAEAPLGILSNSQEEALNEPPDCFIPITTLEPPSQEDVELVAKTIHGEAGICDNIQKAAVAWCILNRVDCPDYPDTIKEVITQPHQFKGYKKDKVPTEEEYQIAFDVIFAWMYGSERLLPKRFLYFHAEDGKNVFTTNHLKGEIWDAKP